MARVQPKAAAGNRRSLAYHLKRTVLPHVVLSLVGLIFLFPFVWLFLNSLKTPQEIFSLPPKLWPEDFQWNNYVRAFQSMPFFGYVLNTLFLVIANIIGHLFSAPLVAYSLAKIRWKGRGVVFALVLATVILPPQVTMIPMYIIFAKLGWVNTYLPLIIPSFLGSSFNIFLLRQFLLGIPNELSDAARIDGASEFRIYWQIMLPLLMPPLAAIAIFTFQGVWHDFFGPLIYLNDERLWTISVGLQGFLQQHGAQWELLMAAATLFTLPSVIAYFIGQKYFIQAGTQLVQYK